MRFQFGIRSLLLLLTTIGLLSLGFRWSFPPRRLLRGFGESVPYSHILDREREVLEFDLREKVFRELLARSNTEVAFLSFGDTEVRTSKKVVEAWVEPPTGFVTRFPKSPVIVRSVSDAVCLLYTSDAADE